MSWMGCDKMEREKNLGIINLFLSKRILSLILGLILTILSIPSPLVALSLQITNKGNSSDYSREVIGGEYFSFKAKWYQDFESEFTLITATGYYYVDVYERDRLLPRSHSHTFEFWAPPVGEKSCDIKVGLMTCAATSSQRDCEQSASDEYRWG